MSLLKESTLGRPAVFQPLINSILDLPVHFAQLRNGCGNAAHRDQMVISSVSGLALTAFPPHVARKVSERVINSAEAHARRTWPQVIQKAIERVQPPFAHQNAARSVILVLATAWIIAALDHALPGNVSFRIGSISGMAMPQSLRVVPSPTTTGPSVPASQAAVKYKQFISALAKAKALPSCLPRRLNVSWASRNYFKPSVFVADKGESDRHNSVPFIVVISGCGSGDTDRSHDSNDKGCENKPFFPHNST